MLPSLSQGFRYSSNDTSRETPTMTSMLLTAVSLTLAAGPADAARAIPDKMDGEWTLVSLEIRGKPAPAGFVKTARLKVEGDKWTVTAGPDGEHGEDGTFKADPSKDPGEIDSFREIERKPAVLKGIF